MNILAIDLGKFNSMCCFFDTDTQEHRFQIVATTKQYLTAVLRNHEIDLVVMEACGPSGWVSDLCHEHMIKTRAYFRAAAATAKFIHHVKRAATLHR